MENNITIRRLTGTGKGKDELHSAQEISFGTGPHNTVRFDPTWDRGVAVRHARLYRDEAGAWWLEDAGSSSGTYLQGQRLTMKRQVGGNLVIELGQGGPKVEAVLPGHGIGQGAARPAARERARSPGGRGLLVSASLVIVALAAGAWLLMKNGLPGTAAVADSDEKLRLVAKKYEQAVGVVVMAEEGSSRPVGTAWAVGPGMFATNSHITEAVEPLLAKGGAVFVVINKNPDLRFRVLKTVTHPKYYTDAKARAGEPPPINADGKVQQIGAYDVGLMMVDGDPPVKFKLAMRAKLEALDAGQRVAFLGFPMESLIGGNIDAHYPVATMQSGIITSVTDAWMANAAPAQSILIHHNLPSAGGASGSPVFDVDGEVVGLHSAGNYTMGLSTAAHRALSQEISKQIRELEAEVKEKLKDKSLTPEQRKAIIDEAEKIAGQLAGAPLSILQMQRVTSASLINFAQRADMLQELLDTNAAGSR